MTAAGVWSKLKALYMTKSLVNKLYLKKKLYTFYMLAGRDGHTKFKENKRKGQCTVGYIPELKRNLISMGTLEKRGYIIELQSGKVKMINGSKVVLSGAR
ncbi:hypothetical protein Tco_1010150, partial [Tanacetum coccineum]